MTIREVNTSLDHVQKELIHAQTFEAGIHGVPINFSEKAETELKELTEEQKRAFEKDEKMFFSKGKNG